MLFSCSYSVSAANKQQKWFYSGICTNATKFQHSTGIWPDKAVSCNKYRNWF